MSKCNVKNRTVFLHDNLEVLYGIDSECIDLVYLDPPFNKNKKFTAPIGSTAEGAEFSDIFRQEDVKEEWLKTIEEDQVELFQYLNGIKGVGKPYNFAYLAYMAIRLIECHRVLKQTGSLYLHCDSTMSHYLKTTLDCIFGEENFRNEIVWSYGGSGRGAKAIAKHFPRNNDILLYYAKDRKRSFHRAIYENKYWAINELPSHIKCADGMYFKTSPRGDYTDDSVALLRKMGRIYETRNGNIRVKYFLKQQGHLVIEPKLCGSVWNIPDMMHTSKAERTGYPTQKPLVLLDRLIKTSSNEGDIVLDPFCGCATTCIAAENNGRHWIGIDVSQKAYDLVKERLDREVVRPDELPQYREEVHLQTRPPTRTDIGASVYETKHVYIISHPKYPGEYKVGIARSVKSRLNAYQTSDPDRSYSLEFSLETHLFRETEAHIHEHFDNKYEWVTADLEDIKREILEYSESHK